MFVGDFQCQESYKVIIEIQRKLKTASISIYRSTHIESTDDDIINNIRENDFISTSFVDSVRKILIILNPFQMSRNMSGSLI